MDHFQGDTPLAHSVKAMILDGFGLGWLPRHLCAQELADGRLALASGSAFQTQLSVWLYRETDNEKSTLNRLWRDLSAG
ncbi:LysR substrate-binding domain-containing protein [Ruegeria sp. 1NDH52C]|uniref:LysR substrate-binding domain-containing protein n=1 Tax=Ruegeria alba TaxID=2916756 RepID=A0ABS9NYN4_9RHOB|nr:LysR substrate-binding domain-containing protein [Ruegeria alba]